MHALNIRNRDTQGQTEPMFDPYRDSLEDVMDNNIDDEVASRNNFLQTSKPSMLVLWPERAISLLFELLDNSTKATSSKGNNSSIFLLRNSSSKLLSSIVPNDLLNSLLKSDDYRL